MGIFSDDRAPAPYVPDLSRPTGAAVDAAGNVTCVVCATQLPMAKADVVGLGYRCPACTAQAQIRELQTGTTSASADLSESDRAAMRAHAQQMIWGGVGLTLLGALLTPFFRKGFVVLIAGLGSIGAGWTRHRHASAA
jgi:hypothetical protein